MHKSATKCNETIDKWCKNKHGASKIIDTLETYQGAARWGDPDSGDGKVDRVLAWGNGATGGSTGISDLQLAQESSILCEKIQAEGIKGCARAREEEQARRGGAGSPVVVGNQRIRPQAPTGSGDELRWPSGVI
jgi:hypothetical protein